MKIDKLTICNMYGIKGTRSYDLSAPIAALWGPNGTGKSSVIEAIRFIITGAGKVNVLHAGETDGFVAASMGDHEVRRIVSFNEGRYKLQSFVDGKKVAAKNAELFLSEQFGASVSDMKLLTSKNLTASLESGAGSLLLSYMDNSISRDQVSDMIIRQNAENTHVSEDDIRSYASVNLPDHVTYESIVAISKRIRDDRCLTKKQGDQMSAKMKTYDLSGKDLKMEDLEETLSALQSAQAAANAARVNAKQMQDQIEKRKNILEKIRSLKSEESACSEKLASLANVMGEIGKVNEDDVSWEISEEQKRTASLHAELAAVEKDISWIDDISSKLSSGGCPFSSQKLTITCTTDMSPVLSDLSSKRKDSDTKRASLQSAITASKAKAEDLAKRLSIVRSYTSLQKNCLELKSRISDLTAMIPPEIKPVKVDETDYRRKISDVQQKMMKVRAYQDYLKTLADVKELAHQWYLEDIFVKALSDDGPIVRCLIEDYRQLLTEAVNGISSTTGIQVIFTNDNGLDMLFKTKGTEFRPYTSLSAGEQVLAYITVSDMLSRLSGYHLIVLDDMDKLDNENLDCVVHLLSDNISGYENVLLAGVNHEGTDSILNKYHVVTL